jgi:hypothetical protein
MAKIKISEIRFFFIKTFYAKEKELITIKGNKTEAVFYLSTVKNHVLIRKH